MAMSRDPGFKFQNFYFSPNSILDFRKVSKFGGNWLKNKKLQAKNKLGWKTPLPPAQSRPGIHVLRNLLVGSVPSPLVTGKIKKILPWLLVKIGKFGHFTLKDSKI